MKLLMLTHRFPYPPTRGDCVRAWGELEHLARRHDVWLACVDRAAPWPAHLAKVKSVCRDVQVVVRSGVGCLLTGGISLLCGESLTAGYFGDARLRGTIQDWSERIGFDAVLTFSSGMAPYAELVDAKRRVLDMNDVDSLKWQSFAARSVRPAAWLYALEAKRLAEMEIRAARTHDVCLLVNERERRKLVELADPKCVAVVRTGVDLARYAVNGAAAHLTTKPIVGMIGSMSYAPNVHSVNWFGRHVWPIIKQREPAAQWLIVGSRPVRSVRRWGRLPGVRVTGFVQEMRPYLRSMRVVASPVSEEIGVQTKLIETLAIGKPAVVTPAAAGGIDYDAEPPFLIAETPEEFAASVLRLFSDESMAVRIGRAARAVAEKYYCVEEQVAMIERWLQPDTADHNDSPKHRSSAARPHVPVREEAVV